ncbi:MAG: HNH endonuclease signature motif containing protein [Steroidobacteraceae bacterium]
MSDFVTIQRFPDYTINRLGEIRNRKGKRMAVWPHPTKWPYLTTALSRDKKPHRVKVHILLAEAFIPNPENLPQVNHKDTDPTNCSLDNLEWVTRAQNSQRTKNHIRGIGITPEVASYIKGKTDWKRGDVKALAERCNVVSSAISNVKIGVTWVAQQASKKQSNQASVSRKESL